MKDFKYLGCRICQLFTETADMQRIIIFFNKSVGCFFTTFRGVDLIVKNAILSSSVRVSMVWKQLLIVEVAKNVLTG